MKRAMGRKVAMGARLFLMAVVSSLTLTTTPPALAVPPEAGTVISGDAVLRGRHTGYGIIETIFSIPVRTTVNPKPALDLRGGDLKTLNRGARATYSFQAFNTGNTPLSAMFDLTEVRGDDFDVNGTLYFDANDNGVVDSGEVAITSLTALQIAPQKKASLIYAFDVPPDTANGQRAIFLLRADARNPDQGESISLEQEVEAEVVVDDASLILLNSGVYRADDRLINYTLRLRNNGLTKIAPFDQIGGEAIVIDGNPASVVMVRSPMPLNTVLHEITDTSGLTPLYNLYGQPEHTYVTTPPADMSLVAAIAFSTDRTYDSGRASDPAFTVAVREHNGPGVISSIATTYFEIDGILSPASSNEVTITVDADAGEMVFATEDFTVEPDYLDYEQPYGLELRSGACNLSPGVDTVQLQVTTNLSGDSEALVATETGPNTGRFRTTSLAMRDSIEATGGNSVVEPSRNDLATAIASCTNQVISASVYVAPGLYVFNSVSDAPLEGVVVSLFEEGGGVEPVATGTTDETGYFSFGIQPEGSYLFEAVSNAGYTFPSQIRNLPTTTRQIDPIASYGGVFQHGGGPVMGVDLPMDEWTEFSLVMEKTANKDTAARGDYVVFTIEARSQTSIGSFQTFIEDTLPKGFIYLPGSARRDGEPIADPDGAPGPVIRFPLDDFNGLASTSIEYVARIGPTAGQGRRTNTALLRGRQIVSGRELTSPVARKTIVVDDSGGVFAEQAAVIGKVFLDLNGDGVQNTDGEVGIPGVKIITSTGISAVTDTFGRYSLFGLRPTTQVFALLRSTLPEGAEPALGDIDDALKPGSRMIDLRRGELKAEDFPIFIPKEQRGMLKRRKDRFEALDNDQSLLRDDIPLTFNGASNRQSSSSEAGLDTKTDLKKRLPNSEQLEETLEEPPPRKAETEAEREARLKALVATLSPDLDFVDLPDEFVSERRSIDVIVKGPAELDITVMVNGQSVNAKRLGGSASDDSTGVQLFEYIALPLDAGENAIGAHFKDPFGNIRGRVERIVYAPGDPAQLDFVVPDEAPADSSTRVPVVVRILDKDGRLVRAPAEVTLSARRGSWDLRDIRPDEPGVQTYIDNGEAAFDYLPPDLVGSDDLIAEAGFGSGKGTIKITPDLGERILVGVVEGAVALRGGDESLVGVIEDDEITPFEKTTEGLRGQLYLKGKILGDTLLTLRYDSDQDTEERLFRDIARDEYYPVYGDSSERGFDAQSSTPLFVKVERGQSYILYGDIAIDPQASEIQLGAYRRAVNGIKAHAEFDKVKLTFFGARTDQSQRILEFPAEGVSGPYDVPLDGYIEGSEVVELITRDRDQPDVIISEDVQTRLTDYSLDFFSDTLIFNRPIQRLDPDLNPVSIRVTFETEAGQGERYLIYGGEARYEPMEGVAVGARHVTSEGTDGNLDRQVISSVYAKADLGKKGWLGKVILEAARSENSEEEEDYAFRATYEVKTEKSGLSVELARTGDDFDPAGSSVGEAREEVRIKAEHQLTPESKGTLDGLYSRDTKSGDRQFGVELRLNRTVSDSLDITSGMRAVRTDEGAETTDVFSGIIGMRWKPYFVPDAAVYAEFEQDFVETGNWRLSLGGEYQATSKLRLFAEGEMTTTDGGNFDIGSGSETAITNKVGVDYAISETMDVFSEYRSDGDMADATVASGVKASWAPTEVSVFRTTIEHVEPMKSAERSTSVALGFDYESEERGILAQVDLEWSGTEEGSGYFSNLGVGYKFNDSVTLLLRNRFAFDTKGDTDQLRNRLRIGAALRPKNNNRLRVLSWYEYEIDKEERTEQAHRWALAGVYTLSDTLSANARYAGEYKEFFSDTVNDANTLHLMQFGAEHEIIPNTLSLAGNVSMFTDHTFETYSFGIGAEVKYNITEQLQIGLGYNHVNLEEDQIRGLYQSGVHLRFKMKFDEDTWDMIDKVSSFGEQLIRLE